MLTRADAEAFDRDDPLKDRLSAFERTRGLYLDGHSLGPPTRRALLRLERTAREEWSERLVGAWNDDGDGGWIDLPARVGAKIARLIGVPPDDVAVSDSVSVNLFKLAAALLPPGKAIAVYEGEFPTDDYVMQGLASLVGAPLIRLASGAPLAGRTIGVLIKSAVDYRTAAAADIARFEAVAREIGAFVIWDLSHATGVLALDLARDGARFAVGCGYKYLNGGPGAPAFLYCMRSEAERLKNPISGWFGHAAPFDFTPDYRPAPSAKRFLAGTPPILSLAALDAALDVFDGVDMRAAEAKAQRLCAVFCTALAASGTDFEIAGGAAWRFDRAALAIRRGAHVGILHKDGYAIIRCLIERGVMGDFRAPNLMRFGFSPLFLRHVDAFDAAQALIDVMRSEAWRDPRFSVKEKVT
jgi:kynureninase